MRLTLAAGLVALLMELVRWEPGMLWPLEGTAVGLLAGATAWCFDERIAAVADALPRGLAWTTAARASAAGALAAVWTAVVLHAGDVSLFGGRDHVLVQGWVAIICGAAYACWRRSGGDDTPGVVFAIGVVPIATAWALIRPLGGRITVFPYVTDSPAAWRASAIGWLTLGAVAAVVLGLALGEARWWRTPLRRFG